MNQIDEFGLDVVVTELTETDPDGISTPTW
jgi:hypothetical protein